MLTYAIIAVVSYLLGSIPFGYILVKVFKKQDIRQTGSGNIGATNVARSGAKGLAVATLLLDAGKGFLAVSFADVFVNIRKHEIIIPGYSPAASILGHVTLVGATAALFAILGHVFPVWLRFKGGKGVATAAGAFGAIAPAAVILVLAVFVVLVATLRYVSLGSIVSAASFPPAAYYLSSDGQVILLVPLVASALLVIGKHHQNIRRLLAGTENRLGAKPKVPPPQEMEKQA